MWALNPRNRCGKTSEKETGEESVTLEAKTSEKETGEKTPVANNPLLTKGMNNFTYKVSVCPVPCTGTDHTRKAISRSWHETGTIKNALSCQFRRHNRQTKNKVSGQTFKVQLTGRKQKSTKSVGPFRSLTYFKTKWSWWSLAYPRG